MLIAQYSVLLEGDWAPTFTKVYFWSHESTAKCSVSITFNKKKKVLLYSTLFVYFTLCLVLYLKSPLHGDVHILTSLDLMDSSEGPRKGKRDTFLRHSPFLWSQLHCLLFSQEIVWDVEMTIACFYLNALLSLYLITVLRTSCIHFTWNTNLPN